VVATVTGGAAWRNMYTLPGSQQSPEGYLASVTSACKNGCVVAASGLEGLLASYIHAMYTLPNRATLVW
jgi:hypothetical protein